MAKISRKKKKSLSTDSSSSVEEVYTVTELSKIINTKLKSSLKHVTILGEISSISYSGRHTYMSMKDENSLISVNFWGQHVQFKQGDNVKVTGRVEYYAKNGRLSVIGKTIESEGKGSIYERYEKLYKKYEKKGYFNNKKPLPQNIRNVGVITAKDGAALQDFLKVMRNNDYDGNVYIFNAKVQGKYCPESVSNGIDFFNNGIVPLGSINNNSNDTDIDSTQSNNTYESSKYAYVTDSNDDIESSGEYVYVTDDESEYDKRIYVDLIVITRGGGSFEDLCGFSEPMVVESIYKSKIYTLNAVGHEVDTTLADHVANYCTGTPSMAGDLVSKECRERSKILDKLTIKIMRKKSEMMNILHVMLNKLNTILLTDPRISYIERLETIKEHMKNKIKNDLTRMLNTMIRCEYKINQSDCKDILTKGFVLALDDDNNIITNGDIFDKNIKLMTSQGEYTVTINRIE